MKDLTGHRFGRLTATRPTDQREGTNVIWECACDCGSITYVSSRKLGSGHTQSCGCLQKETATETAKEIVKKRTVVTGQRFGRLLAVRATDQRNNNKVIWECKCDCGNTVYIKSTLLKNGATKSCGCLRKETMVRNRLQAKRPYPQNPCNDDKHENE